MAKSDPRKPVVAVTGASGMLGHDVTLALRDHGYEVVPFDRISCDVTDAEVCRAVIGNSGATVVINCAAYTNVNGAESDQATAMAVNGKGAANVSMACRENGARCVHLSTDYVFDGTKDRAYEPSDAVNPLNFYGISKLAGEQSISENLPQEQWCIVRTSWLFGSHGPNFVKTMLRLGREGKDIKIIDDQVGAPTYTVDLAKALVEITLHGTSGILHATNTGACSWFEFASKIFQLSGVTPASILPCTSADFPTPAVRPANSRLSPASLISAGIPPLPSWENALERYLAETGELRT